VCQINKRFLSLLGVTENLHDYIAELKPDGLHIDVMDGHAVNNLGLPLWIIPSLPKLPIQIHLMTNPTELFVEMTLAVNPDMIFFHPKWSQDPEKLYKALSTNGAEVGIVWDDDDSEQYFHLTDTLLCMTVVPGRSGQAFLHARLARIREFSQTHKIWLDGGINSDTIQLFKDMNVAGFILGNGARGVLG
jgi:pentose-5-phosphate-3-epimerase